MHLSNCYQIVQVGPKK